MQKLSEDVLKSLFDERTYERGRKYYENGHVSKPSRYNDTIYAEVTGNSPEPYEVSARIADNDTFTRCTCPVGGMCKHGVALLLKWIHEPKTFSDMGKIYRTLENKSKEDLLGIIKKAIDKHPYLIDDLNIRSEGVKDMGGVDANILIKRIKRMLSDDDSYYSASVVKRFDDVRNAADTLMKNERYADASRVYLELVGAGLKIFGDFLEYDDITDQAADLIERSIRSFRECAPHANEAEKDGLFSRILGIISLDDWGMDMDGLFYGVVTKENIGRIESRLMSGEKVPTEDGIFDYSIEWAIDLLDDLYEHLDIPREKPDQQH